MASGGQVRQSQWTEGKPIASAVIPCYNYGTYVRDAIGSVTSQTLRDLEVIVVDDGSDDPLTLQVLERLRLERIRVIRQRNRGLPAARNAGVRRSQGKYVCCLDADDMLEPTYIEKAVALLECRPDIGFAYPWPRRFGQAEGVWQNPEYDFSMLLRGNLLNHPAVFRRRAWRDAGGFWDGLREGYEDWEFWINLGAHGYPGARIAEPLFLYRKHGRSLIDKATEKHEKLVALIQARHRRLYQNDEHVTAIQRGFRDRIADIPFLNLSRVEQYLKSGVFARVLVSGGAEPELSMALQASHTPDGGIATLYWLATAPSRVCGALEARPSIACSYFLPDFLPASVWDSFVQNFLETRRPAEVWLCRSAVSEPILRWQRNGEGRPRCVLCVTREQDVEWLAGLDLEGPKDIVATSEELASRVDRISPGRIQLVAGALQARRREAS